MEKRAKTQFWLEFFLDGLSLWLGFAISFVILKLFSERLDERPISEWIQYIVLLGASYIATFLLFHTSIDIHQRNRLVEVVNILKNNVLVFLVFLALLLLFKNELMVIRRLYALVFAFYLLFTSISRYYLKRWLTGSFSEQKSKIASYTGVLTVKDRAENFVSELKEDWSVKVTGVALLDNFVENGRFVYDKNLFFGSQDEGSTVATKKKINFPHIICDDVPVIATDNRFLDWIRSAPLDEVFINLPYEYSEDISEIVEELESMGVTVHINVPTLDNMLNESNFNNINCKMYAGYPIATFAPAVHSSSQLALKRFVDVVLSIIGIILSIPIVAIVAIPLLIESPGPLIFKQERVGKNGRIFKMYKLRSMYKDAEKRKAELMKHNKMDGLMFKMDNDPRITKVGRIIRKLSIDELPQFVNVLKGDMSLIGTRPPTVKEFEQYENRHKRRLSMRPGITGMWQVSGRSDIIDFEEVVRLDCEYIDNWSTLLDIKIFFKTIKVVLTHKGAE